MCHSPKCHCLRTPMCYVYAWCHTLPVSVKKTFLRKRLHLGKCASEHKIRGWSGEQFLLLDCRARSCAKGVFVSQTPVCAFTPLRSEMRFHFAANDTHTHTHTHTHTETTRANTYITWFNVNQYG